MIHQCMIQPLGPAACCRHIARCECRAGPVQVSAAPVVGGTGLIMCRRSSVTAFPAAAAMRIDSVAPGRPAHTCSEQAFRSSGSVSCSLLHYYLSSELSLIASAPLGPTQKGSRRSVGAPAAVGAPRPPPGCK